MTVVAMIDDSCQCVGLFLLLLLLLLPLFVYKIRILFCP